MWRYRIATRSAALCKPINCAAPRGSSADRVSYARLQRACLTKYERGSNHCSRFDWSHDLLFSRLFFWGFAKPHARATAVLIDELDAATSKARRNAASFTSVTG